MSRRGHRLTAMERGGGPLRAAGSMYESCGERTSAGRYGRGQSDTRSDTAL